jgi:hypothetical protein
VYVRRVFRGVSGDRGVCKQGLSRRHREAEAEGRARRSLGASHGGKTSTKAGSLFRRHGEARLQEK